MRWSRPGRSSGNGALWFSRAVAHAVAIVGLLACGAGGVDAQAPSEPSSRGPVKVLVLNSYHDGFVWSDSMLAGMFRTFDRDGGVADVIVEHMDTKRHPDQNHLELLSGFYRRKFAGRRFDVVVAADNNALDFLLPRRESLFPDTPVVFCGINGFVPEMLHGQTNITGVVERGDWDATIAVALKLHPNARRIVTVLADTVTSAAVGREIAAAFAPYAGERTIEFWRGRTIEETLERVANLPADVIVLRVGIGVSANGAVIDPVQAARAVGGASSAPVYTGWEMEVVGGIVGGRVISGEAQGKAGAEIALRVAHGERADAIPIVSESPNRFVFDARALARFGVPQERVPSGAVLLNVSESLFQRHRGVIWTTILVVAGLTVLVGVLSVNIARRRRVERALRSREEQLRAIIDNSPSTVVLKDRQGRFQLANKAYFERFSLTADDLPDLDLDGIFTPEVARRILEEDARTLATGEPREFEIVSRNADGAMTPQLLVKFPIRAEDGEIVGTGTFGFDIAERKRDEARARQLQEDLAHLMRRAVMGEMATGLAHELNQPLAAIANFAAGARRRLKSGTLPESAVSGIFDTIIQQALRAGDTIRRIRQLIHRQDAEKHPMDVNETIESTVRYVLHDANRPPVSIETRLAPDLPAIAANAVQIRQVILSLVQNAIDAVSEFAGSERRIVISTGPGPDGGVAVAVADSGAGIPEDVIDQVFEPFFTTRDGRFGMGLNVCRTIVERHGGTLTIESTADVGTVARFTLAAESQSIAA